MDQQTAQLLADETARFYETCADSFSATRDRPWRGWEQLAPRFSCCCDEARAAGRAPRLLDVGCGNFRFERFLGDGWEVSGIDRCVPLAQDPPAGCRYVAADVATWEPIAAQRHAFDLVVAFGVLHHIPGQEARRLVVQRAASCVAPGGLLALSLWQLQKNDRLLRRAEKATARFLTQHPDVRLGPGDWLLGWQGREDVFRYCHGFTDEECVDLARATGLSLVEVLDADQGNRYLVLATAGRTGAAESARNDRKNGPGAVALS